MILLRSIFRCKVSCKDSIFFYFKPFSLLLFLYFLVSSIDSLSFSALVFKFKLTNLIALSLFLFSFAIFKLYRISRAFFVLGSIILGVMCISAFNSQNLIVCVGFIFLFIFNYVFYFVFSYNLFRIFSPKQVLQLYSRSFYCVGFYAFSQVLFSLGGVFLPGIKQFIFGIARGQAFAYEPSFYALYMTPFTIFSTTRFLLQRKEDRNIGDVLWPNLFLFASTSTGCVFSYVFYLFFILVFRWMNVFRTSQISIKKIFFKFFVVCLSGFSLLWIVNKKLLVSGFLKFFYSGLNHFSLQDRWRGLVEYWNIFLENPLIGTGLGSGPYYIAKQKLGYVDVMDKWVLNYFSPMNVTTEILAGLGTLGGVAFLAFFILLIQLFRSALKVTNATENERTILIALALSVCVMLATLQFNQSIMRCYMWIHMGVFCGYARGLIEKYSLSKSSVAA